MHMPISLLWTLRVKASALQSWKLAFSFKCNPLEENLLAFGHQQCLPMHLSLNSSDPDVVIDFYRTADLP